MSAPTKAVIPVVGNDKGVVCIAYNITCFCKSEGIYGVASAMDGGGSTQQRCFCNSKNSPSTNIHGCIFVDEVSAPHICKSALFSNYFFCMIFFLLRRTGVPPPRFPLVSSCLFCLLPAVLLLSSKTASALSKRQKGYRFNRCPDANFPYICTYPPIPP